MSDHDHDERTSKTLVVETISAAGLWLTGWLFTVGFADLSLGKAVLGLVLWPYYAGDAAR